jgi:hypothetical protein
VSLGDINQQLSLVQEYAANLSPPLPMVDTPHQLNLRIRQIEPDVRLAQLLRGHRGRCAHRQILGALVHREKHDLALADKSFANARIA